MELSTKLGQKRRRLRRKLAEQIVQDEVKRAKRTDIELNNATRRETEESSQGTDIDILDHNNTPCELIVPESDLCVSCDPEMEANVGGSDTQDTSVSDRLVFDPETETNVGGSCHNIYSDTEDTSVSDTYLENSPVFDPDLDGLDTDSLFSESDSDSGILDASMFVHDVDSEDIDQGSVDIIFRTL